MKNNTKQKYLINSSVIIAGAVLIAILLNSILIAFDKKMSLEIDLTADEIYQLTDESKSVVDRIDEEMEIVLLYDGTNYDAYSLNLLNNILNLYAEENSNIKIKTIDFINNMMDLQPYVTALQNVTDPYYAMVFAQGEHYEIAQSNSYSTTTGNSTIERTVTNKLATFVDGYGISEITMTSGHGERINEGFHSILSMYQYTINTVDLLQQELPEPGKSLVIVNAPTGDFSVEEIEKLDAYLDRGGNVQIYFDPLANKDALPRLESYLETEWAIKRNHQVIVDSDNTLSFEDDLFGTISVAKLTDSELVAPISASRKNIMYSLSNSLEILGDKPNTIEITPVLQTNSNAYLKDVTSVRESKTGSDPSGTYNVLLSATRTNYTLNEEVFTGKLLISGSGYTMDTLIGDTRYANEDLLINSFNWMRGSKAGITVREKELPQGSLAVPNGQFWPWFIALVVLIPALILGGGIFTWVKRRYK